ncbi:hypothetical protein [Kitasatospora sp. P5_F3]
MSSVFVGREAEHVAYGVRSGVLECAGSGVAVGRQLSDLSRWLPPLLPEAEPVDAPPVATRARPAEELVRRLGSYERPPHHPRRRAVGDVGVAVQVEARAVAALRRREQGLRVDSSEPVDGHGSAAGSMTAGRGEACRTVRVWVLQVRATYS